MNDQEKKEIHFLMSFFAQPQTAQWKQVPDKFSEVIFDVSPFYTKTEAPIELLSLVLVYLTENIGNNFADSDLAEILFEAYVLLNDFMLESNRNVIFTKRDEPEQLDYAWKSFGRICAEALKFESLTMFETDGINFHYFVEKYAIIE